MIHMQMIHCILDLGVMTIQVGLFVCNSSKRYGYVYVVNCKIRPLKIFKLQSISI